MKLNEIKTGDNLLVTSNKWLSRTIVKVMKDWGKKTNRHLDKVYSHAGTLIWSGGELYVFESVDGGFKPRLFEDHYDLVDSDLAIMRRNKPLNKTDEDRVINAAFRLTRKSTSYQYWNFIQWLSTVYLGIKMFNTKKEDNDKFEYCYESTMEIRKALNPENYGNVDMTDIYDLMLDPNYKVIYQSKG